MVRPMNMVTMGMNRWPARHHHVAEHRQFVFRHAVQAMAFGFEVHCEKHRHVIHHRRNDGPHRDGGVGHGEGYAITKAAAPITGGMIWLPPVERR